MHSICALCSKLSAFWSRDINKEDIERMSEWLKEKKDDNESIYCFSGGTSPFPPPALVSTLSSRNQYPQLTERLVISVNPVN